MELTPRGITRSVVRRANAFGATPISSRGVLSRATRIGDRDGISALRRAVRKQVVLITGASSGIGRSAALKFGEAGATVLLVARSEEALDEVVEEIGSLGGLAFAYPCDLTDFDQVDVLVAKVLDRHDHVDIL